MRKILLYVGLFLLLTAGAKSEAETSALRSLLTGDDGRGWEAVGRLDIGKSGFCTATLISERIVLTAGHCMFDKETGARIDPGELEFLAGWRGGRASAYRGVRRAVVHPNYVFSSENVQARVRYDLALLELDRPIRSTSIKPFTTRAQPAKGAAVGVVSYALHRAESPSLQEKCNVLARQAGALVLSCSVDFGASGAPIFVLENGEAKIVSVVSAKAMARDLPVALGTSLKGSLDPMFAMLQAGEGAVLRTAATGAPVQVNRPGALPANGGAKFVRP